MSRMRVVVRPVVGRMIVAVVPRFSGVLMAVFVLMTVLVSVVMLMFVRMFRFSVPVFMRVRVNMFMGMKMLVFMVALHYELLSFVVNV
ncbi:MAG TPA: hypothetical protein VMC85_03325 [Desulfomonilaceae bacterium]|nr:hypothetical protein [Desulfomonilaceae bacterium]